MKVGQANTFRMQGIQSRGSDIGISMGCNVSVALIIGDDHNHVRPNLVKSENRGFTSLGSTTEEKDADQDYG